MSDISKFSDLPWFLKKGIIERSGEVVNKLTREQRYKRYCLELKKELDYVFDLVRSRITVLQNYRPAGEVLRLAKVQQINELKDFLIYFQSFYDLISDRRCLELMTSNDVKSEFQLFRFVAFNNEFTELVPILKGLKMEFEEWDSDSDVSSIETSDEDEDDSDEPQDPPSGGGAGGGAGARAGAIA